MKTTLLSAAAVASLALAVAGAARGPAPAAQLPQPDPDPRAKDAEPLPPAPKAGPNSTLIEKPDVKGLILEVLPDKKTRRVLMAAEVTLREGPLEVFLCKKGTKEHEAILRAEYDARLIHELLLLAGAKPGSPTQFVNPRTNEPEYKPASGTKLKVTVHYRKDGKLHTHPAQEWIWDVKAKKPMQYDWVFAGSQLLKNPDRPEAPPYYAANSGEVISISNFPYSMLEIPVDISKDDANLTYEVKTDKVPPLFSKVWVILEPVPDKK
jgi:hypothetical protein